CPDRRRQVTNAALAERAHHQGAVAVRCSQTRVQFALRSRTVRPRARRDAYLSGKEARHRRRAPPGVAGKVGTTGAGNRAAAKFSTTRACLIEWGKGRV